MTFSAKTELCPGCPAAVWGDAFIKGLPFDNISYAAGISAPSQPERPRPIVSADTAQALEIAWLRRLLTWCRPRLLRNEYRQSLDRYLAAGPTAAPDDATITNGQRDL